MRVRRLWWAGLSFALVAAMDAAPTPIDAAQTARGGQVQSEPAPIKRGQAPRPDEYPPEFDALHYDIRISIPLDGAIIEGSTTLQIDATAGAPATLPLDFTGLSVTAVRMNGSVSTFTQRDGKLFIPVPPASRARRLAVAIDYRGTPDDGLLIRNNVHGHRVAFVDNWPNRARFWFPSLDHPSDKATASFNVSVPAQWQVVANGVRIENVGQDRAGAGRRVFQWRITQPISTYNMVFGAADFRVHRVGRPCFSNGRCVAVSTWLFPESVAKAAVSFRRTPAMVDYFSRLIGAFPYAKLAHVQSSTEFLGMENATAIFYPEKDLADGKNIEETVAHETAHQWFGDSVTEADWHDLWLSEGFATYFSALFIEHADGAGPFRTVMETARAKIINAKVVGRPIVDRGDGDLFQLLNTNNYEKGGWVLHMLRGQLGDAKFFAGIRRYYQRHQHRTATTADFQRAMEEAAGNRLDTVFNQWVFSPGFPRLRLTWRWNGDQRTVSGVIEQTQPAGWPTFQMAMVIEVVAPGRSRRHTVQLDERSESFSIPIDSEPDRVVMDPDGWLLKDVVTD